MEIFNVTSIKSGRATVGFSLVMFTALAVAGIVLLEMNTRASDADPSTGFNGNILFIGGHTNFGLTATTELLEPPTYGFARASLTASMNVPRYHATATLIATGPNAGKILIAGGASPSVSYLASTELYDPASNSFAPANETASMNTGRSEATATLLTTGPNAGKILIAGGLGSIDALASTELYDPMTNSFAPSNQTASMNTSRYQASASSITTGPNAGKILIAGGLHFDGIGEILASTELYDPVTNSFAPSDQTASMNVARDGMTATTISNGPNAGKILIAGGAYISSDGRFTLLSSTDLYDPDSNSFAPTNQTASMNFTRYLATASTIVTGSNVGKILLSGGETDDGDNSHFFASSTDLYDPANNSFAPANQMASMNLGRIGATAVTLLSQPNAGKIVIAGGSVQGSVDTASTELYDPLTNSFAPANQTMSMNLARSEALAIQLPEIPQKGPIIVVNRTSSINRTLTIPSGVQNGDLLLAFYSYWSVANATPPSGWSLLHTASATNSGTVSVWYRYANNDAPGSTYNWTFSGPGPYEAGGIVAYRGAALTSFEDGFCTDHGSGGTPSLCSFKTNFSNDLYVGFFSCENSLVFLPVDLGAQVMNQYLKGSHFGLAAVAKSLGAPGVVPVDVASMNNGGWATIAFAIKPAITGPTATPTSTPTPTLTPTPTSTPTPGPIAPLGFTSTTSTTQKVPAGVQNGDLLLAFYSYWSLTFVTAPSGWTLLHSATSSGSGVMTVWYRFANSNPPGSNFTWTFSGQAYEAGGMLAYRGVGPSFEDGSCTSQSHNTMPTLCGFATTHSNDLYVGLISTENTNLMLPGDLTSILLNQYVNGSHFGVAAADKTLGAAGLVPSEFASMNSGGWASIAFALRGP